MENWGGCGGCGGADAAQRGDTKRTLPGSSGSRCNGTVAWVRLMLCSQSIRRRATKPCSHNRSSPRCQREGWGSAPSWRVRFSPRKTGAWSCTLTARDRSGRTQYTGPPLHFTVVARARTDSARGWLAISNKQPLALVESMCPRNIFSTSTAFAGQETPGECGFHAVGANLLYFHDTRRAQPIDRLSTYLAFLRNLSTHGGNYGKLSGHATLSSLSTFRCLLRPVLCDEQPF